MAFKLSDVLKLLPVVGPAVAAAPQFVNIFNSIVDALDPDDQEQAKEAYEDLIRGELEGFKRLDEKLAAAERRGR